MEPSTRRTVLFASLLTAWPIGLFAARAEAINPAETPVTLPDEDQMDGMDGRAAAQR
jgi:hypothetical protein